MSSFNEKLKKITLKEMLSFFIVLFIIHYLLNSLNIVQVDTVWIYIFIIFYFVFKLKDAIPYVGEDISELFFPNLIRTILLVVILNIFLSYGMLYFSNFILGFVQSRNIFNSFLTGSLISTIIISPISEELIFRGVFLNRLKLILPTTFAILVSSLLFASLHSFGSIFSAFIFGVCVAILYLKTENIFVPILAHLLNNLFAEIIVRMDYNGLLFTNDLVILIMSILAILSLIVIFISILKELNSIKNNKF
ncbi:CPBP family intramembrane glutamic endopeptidase [Methanobrevibacter sp.]|uniref:CPBP family intramembrane glutamic endopeptidase n=1 Tax=Methanobrevibacter sp. TaxID=66852 RepID=UPI0025CCD96C|nr:type II CAAX endopeptidase family protein [Methanobrevibacter sp.]MBR4447277.1 CPBP family intramembrane metalloprotease [Methanobrevibacter sp.]